MKFSTAVVALLSAAVASATPTAFSGRSEQSVVLNDDHKIPGDSPLELCDTDHSDDILTIESVDLLPNPPQAGEDLIIKAKGTTTQDIEEGAYVHLVVKYGLIRLISTKADLCEQIKNVELECPVKEGELEIEKIVKLPAEIPPGKYSVTADVFTKDDEPVTCLKAAVVFSRSSNMFSLEL